MGAFIVTVIGAIFLGVFVIVLIWFITKTVKGQKILNFIEKVVEQSHVPIKDHDEFEVSLKEFKKAEQEERERLAPVLGQLVEECKKKNQTSKITLKSYKTLELEEVIDQLETLPILELYHIHKVLLSRVN